MCMQVQSILIFLSGISRLYFSLQHCSFQLFSVPKFPFSHQCFQTRSSNENFQRMSKFVDIYSNLTKFPEFSWNFPELLFFSLFKSTHQSSPPGGSRCTGASSRGGNPTQQRIGRATAEIYSELLFGAAPQQQRQRGKKIVRFKYLISSLSSVEEDRRGKIAKQFWRSSPTKNSEAQRDYTLLQEARLLVQNESKYTSPYIKSEVEDTPVAARDPCQ